jgi:hypothetical protein
VAVIGMTKTQILHEIKRTTEANGGMPLGVDRFGNETGVKAWDWQKFWPRWNEAIREAGYMKTTFWISTILFSLCLCGCKPKETALSGQVFIVTRDSQNIKLGLVEVQLLQKQSVVNFLLKRQAEIDSEIKSRNNEHAKAKLDLDGAQKDFNTVDPSLDYQDLKSKYDALTSQVASYTKESLSQGDELEAARQDFLEAKNELETANESLHEYYSEVALQKSRTMGDLARANVKWTEENAPAADAAASEALQLSDELDKIKPFVEKLESAKQQVEGLLHPSIKTYFVGFSPVVIQKSVTDADGKFSLKFAQGNDFTLFA